MDLFNKSFNIASLSAGDKIILGSSVGSKIYTNVSGTGFISEDSTWQLVQSNDKVTWVSIAGTQFTGENAVSVQNAGEVFNALYLGVELISKATETAGVVTINTSAK